MDPKLLASYRAPQRPPVFLVTRPATSVRRPSGRLIAYAFAVGITVVVCAAAIIHYV